MFTLADCALRNVNATTVAASRHPDHHPLVTPAYPGFRQGFRLLAGFLFLRVFVLPAGCAWRRARLTVCTLRTVFAEYRRFPAVGFAVRFTKRGRRPAEKLRTKEIRDNCPNITNFLCQQTYITISTKYTGDNQPLKSLSLHL